MWASSASSRFNDLFDFGSILSVLTEREPSAKELDRSICILVYSAAVS